MTVRTKTFARPPLALVRALVPALVVLTLSACGGSNDDEVEGVGGGAVTGDQGDAGAGDGSAGDGSAGDGGAGDGTGGGEAEAGGAEDGVAGGEGTGDGDAGTPAAPSGEPGRGRFLDAAVSGLGYATASGAGLTDADGGFDYRGGETITFSIGDVTLPAVTARDTLTALDLFGTSDTNAPAVVNLNRLLQTLDVDADPSNGIAIDEAAALAASGLSIDFAAAGFDEAVVNLVANAGGAASELVTPQAATTHFIGTLRDNGIDPSNCASTHPAVGRSAPLVGLAHAVEGTVTVLDDCTLEVSGFGYDGGGPAVYFFGGSGRDYVNRAIPLGPALNGRLYADDTLRLTLPEGRTFDDVDSLSVWCFEFRANFGDAFFGDP